jgi:imidazoleglycerol-phosphate dehydratase/histidinol-phosphatase
MGLRGFRVGPLGLTWALIADEILGAPRVAVVERRTAETNIRVRVALGESGCDISTGIGFFDHMLEQIAVHGGFGLQLSCDGDLHVDEHHTIEDCALAFGSALSQALGDRRGIERFGFVLPMDESRATVAIDLGGRPFLRFEAEFARDAVGGFPTEMAPHFFRSLAQTLGATIHIDVIGDNTHHMIEAAFKGVGRALRPALIRESQAMPSSKGVLV